jgi:hypothetical protein
MGYLRALLRGRGPHRIAMGTAVGVGVATVPVLGFQTVLAVLLATALRANRLAAATFVWVSNPVFFYLDYRVGRFLLERLRVIDVTPADGLTLNELVSHLTTVFLVPVLAGCVVMALVFGLASYLVALRVVRSYRERIRGRARSG